MKQECTSAYETDLMLHAAAKDETFPSSSWSQGSERIATDRPNDKGQAVVPSLDDRKNKTPDFKEAENSVTEITRLRQVNQKGMKSLQYM